MKRTKRIKNLSFLLVTALLLALAACGTEKEVNEPPTQSTPTELFEAIWDAIPSDKKIPAFGGDYENSVSDKPAAFLGSAETFDSLLGIPAELFGKIDGAASLMHMMNVNSFTGAVLHFSTAGDAVASTETIKNHILERRWMCGFPDKVIVIDLGGGNLLTAFGINEAVDPVRDAALSAIEGAQLLCEAVIE